jgi:hypothetical protein
MARLPTNRPATTDDVLFSAEQYASGASGTANFVNLETLELVEGGRFLHR